jgi:hypothetical protein
MLYPRFFLLLLCFSSLATPLNSMEIEATSHEFNHIIMPLVMNHLDWKNIRNIQSTNKTINQSCSIDNAHAFLNLSEEAHLEFLSLYATKNPNKFNDKVKILNKYQSTYLFPEITSLEEQSKRTFLQAVIMAGNNELARLLIEKGIDINQCDKYENTPLHIAVSCNNKEIIELLLEAGADCNITNYNYETPLHTAAYNNYKDIIKLLIEKGANPYALNNESNTPYNLIMTLWRHTDTMDLFD